MSVITKKTILVVEDDPSISVSIRELLEEDDYHVLTAPNGEVALKVLETTQNVSLILLDLMMPVMDGFQFMENQSSDSSIRHIPVVVMSANGRLEETKARSPAMDYLKKPVDIFHLLDVVKRHST